MHSPFSRRIPRSSSINHLNDTPTTLSKAYDVHSEDSAQISRDELSRYPPFSEAGKARPVEQPLTAAFTT